jgi:broad specificity phosphatase PhoE
MSFMRSPAIVIVTAVSALVMSSFTPRQPVAGEPTTLLIVRHADRDGDKDALTEAGAVRARELARAASKAGVAAIFCTKTERTRKTAAPVAASLGLAPVELDPQDVAGLVKQVFEGHRGKIVLVVGHSNTIPKIVAAAGGPRIPDLAETDFDDLLVLTVGPGAQPSVGLVILQYGAPTP